MADYHSVLTKAVANLPPSSTAASRQAIYDRAHRALVTQLRSLRPPLHESDIEREVAALDEAIAQVEARLPPPSRPPTPAPRPIVPPAPLPSQSPIAPPNAPLDLLGASKRPSRKEKLARPDDASGGVPMVQPRRRVAAKTPRSSVGIPPKPRKRRGNKELFLGALEKLCARDRPFVSNSKLMSNIGWKTEKYTHVKNQLITAGEIIVGPGQGGTVGLTKLPGTDLKRTLHLFISYSHRDEAIKEELIKHLSPLKRLNLIADWHDREIEAGDKWKEAISENLERANIVILLISIDFINSEYCYGVEMETAIRRARDGHTVVVPVIARNCMWKSSPFAEFQALPTDAKAISNWPDQDEALTVVAEGVRQIAERLLGGK